MKKHNCQFKLQTDLLNLIKLVCNRNATSKLFTKECFRFVLVLKNLVQCPCFVSYSQLPNCTSQFRLSIYTLYLLSLVEMSYQTFP